VTCRYQQFFFSGFHAVRHHSFDLRLRRSRSDGKRPRFVGLPRSSPRYCRRTFVGYRSTTSQCRRVERCRGESSLASFSCGVVCSENPERSIFTLGLFCFKSGSKSMLLLSESGSVLSTPPGETHSSFELLNNNFSVPAMETYYNCRLLEFPSFSSKQHLVQVSFLIL